MTHRPLIKLELDQPPIDDNVRRIVEAFHPVRIVMFGSRARGKFRPDSDLDLIIEVDADRGLTPLDRMREVAALFPHRTWTMDAVVYTTDEIRDIQDWKGTILTPARNEGKILYERKAA
jgi:predicted nucleotidyltransferase